MERIRVQLGEIEYSVPRLNLGQQRRLLALSSRAADKDDIDALVSRGLDIAKVIFERAEPTIADLEQIECSLAELRTATTAVQEFSGMMATEPGKAEPKAAA